MFLNKTERIIAKSLILAQEASDSGKEIGRVYGNTAHLKRVANFKGYALKTEAIMRALNLIDSTPKGKFSYWCEYKPDQNGCRSVITYVNVKVGDELHQISYHTPGKLVTKDLKRKVGNGRKILWDHKSSKDTAELLAALLLA